MSRRKRVDPEPMLIAENPDASTMSTGGPIIASIPSTQVDRANALARAREEGEREGRIAAMAECAAIALALELGHEQTAPDWAVGASDVRMAILAELHRRFPNDPWVEHHLKIRGLK